jgi:hypothetical protein
MLQDFSNFFIRCVFQNYLSKTNFRAFSVIWGDFENPQNIQILFFYFNILGHACPYSYAWPKHERAKI